MTPPSPRRAAIAGLLTSLAVLACGRAGLDPFPDDGAGGLGGEGATGPSGPTTATATGTNTGTTTTSGPGGGGGEGGGGPCTVAQECEDFDPCTTNRCDGGQCFFPLRDDDQDGVVAIQCGGGDCNDQNPQVFPGHPEDCFDGSDNDCNGVSDCFDPACTNVPNCGCQPVPEQCQNGVDDDCDTFADCFDTSCIGTPACGCLPSEAGLCQNGFDDDCDGAFDCDDGDCAGTPACQCQAQQESCTNGADDDCDLLIDCGDPDCQGMFPCACVPPGSPEVCTDLLDNDCDGLPDCADPSCLVSPACQMCTAEICNDGVDNDCDLAIDCADSACFLSPSCPVQPEICNNALDDDFDGLTDCLDPDCAQNPLCQQQQANCLSPLLITSSGSYFGDTTGHVSETKGSCGGDAGEAVFYIVLSAPSFVHLDSVGTSFDSTLYVRTGACNTGVEIGCDDDSGGNLASDLTFTILYPGTYFIFLDGFTVDPQFGANEGPFQLNVQIVPNPPEICDDGIDNDGDVYVDCADPQCTSVGACLNCNAGQPPTAEFEPSRCTDGQDNDCDGLVDGSDDDCHASPVYVTEFCNGIDETGNNVIDDFSCRCANDTECDEIGQICYTHTVRTCGIPCQNFFGDVCPFIASGSACNSVTQQCEFP